MRRVEEGFSTPVCGQPSWEHVPSTDLVAITQAWLPPEFCRSCAASVAVVLLCCNGARSGEPRDVWRHLLCSQHQERALRLLQRCACSPRAPVDFSVFCDTICRFIPA